MMKTSLFLACAVMALVSCKPAAEKNDAAQAPEAASDSVKVTFNEENFPDSTLDLNTYSGGIQHIGLPTANVQRTIDFYEGLGFKLATRHDIDGRDFAFMQLGTCLIEVIPNADPAMENGAVDHFCLDVKNIDELFENLKAAGYTMLSEKVNEIAFWKNGAKYFFIQGPNNEKIEFCEIL